MSRALTMPMKEAEVWQHIAAETGTEPLRPQQQVLLEPLPSDPWEFATKCCWTYDQRAAEFGRAVEELFPAKEHLRLFIEAVQREPRLWCEKSVQIMISWALAAWALHDVLNNRGHEGAWFCLDRVLASKHLDERVHRMYARIPAVYAKPMARMVGGDFEVYHDDDERVPTSSIRAMAQETSEGDTAGKRSTGWTWTWGVVDEGAKTRKLEAILANLANRCGKVIVPSSVDGSTTYHHRIGYGKSLAAADQLNLVEPELLPGERGRPMHGVKCWKRFGWHCMEIRYDSDPAKDPRTAEGLRWFNLPTTLASRAVTHDWRRDMDIDAKVSSGTPVFSDTERIHDERAVWRPKLALFCGWDYSFLANVAHILQIVPRAEGLPEVHSLAEIFVPNCEAYAFAREVRRQREEMFPEAEFTDCGDDSQNQRTATGVVADQIGKALGKTLISEPTGSGGVQKRVGAWQMVISNGLYYWDPVTCPLTKRAVESEWKRDKKGKPLDIHPWKDVCDGPGYVFQNVMDITTDERENVTRVELRPMYRGSGAVIERGPKPDERREVWRQGREDEGGREGEIAR